MTIPVAVSPSVLTPGVYLSINLLAGAAGPGTGTLRVLLLAPKSTAGTITADSEVYRAGSVDDAATKFGFGTPGHLAAIQLYDAYPAVQCDLASPTAGATAATGDITLAGTPTSANVVRVEIAGRSLDVPWAAGVAHTSQKTVVTAAINAAAVSMPLPVTAVDGAGGVTTCTGRVTGTISNDILVRAYLLYAQSGTETAAPGTETALAGGTTEFNVTTILGVVAAYEYHYIILCTSNADALLTTTSNAAKLKTHIATYNTGHSAKLQQGIYGHTKTVANATTGAANRNIGYMQHVFMQSARSLPCEFAAAEAGDRLAAIMLDAAANRIANAPGIDLHGSRDVVADRLTDAESETLIGGGVTPYDFDPNEVIRVVRPITTYSLDTLGGPDRRLLDVQNVDATYIIARDLRSALPIEFPNAKIMPDAPAGTDPPPEGVIEERDVKSFVISRLQSWARKGVVQKARLDEVIADGSLIVAVDSTDATQVNILIPFKIVPPLAKMGIVMNREPA